MNKKLRKIVIGTLMTSSLMVSTAMPTFGNNLVHRVVQGDTLWKISQQYGVTLGDIYNANPGYNAHTVLHIGANINIPTRQQSLTYTVQREDTPWIISNKFNVNLNEFLRVNGLKAGDPIYPGQKVVIPSSTTNQSTPTSYIVQNGDTPWIISNKFNVSLNEFLRVNDLQIGDHIYAGQRVTIPAGGQTLGPTLPQNGATPSKTFIQHRVVSGDDLWKISIQYGIPFAELLQVNGFKENHLLRIGDMVRVPVYHIPVKPTPGPQFGELLDWWTEAQYVVPIGSEFKVIDFYTGKQWNMKRTIGANHADCEPLTARDAAIMKEVWGGSYSWNTRPVIIEIKGRRIAASASSMPHDIQYITNNNFNGHVDIHFYNSTRHKDGLKDPSHQRNVLIAAGKQ